MEYDVEKKIKVEKKIQIKKPKMYAVMLHNNDITAFIAVIDVLEKIFNIGMQRAQQVMMDAHRLGSAQCFSSSKEICRTKLEEVHAYCEKRRVEVPTIEGYYPHYEDLIFTVEELDKGAE